MIEPVAIVLAAGEGRRMQSDLPKVLHQACGRPLVEYVFDAARAAGAVRQVVVVGYQAAVVRDAVGHHADIEFALQAERLGTGHAVLMCREALLDHDGPILVLYGDMPLVRPDSLRALLSVQREEGAACVVGTAETDENEGLGRIVRDAEGEFLRIVEEVDATSAERAIREINTGCYAFDGPALWESLALVKPNNRQGQYYLTDTCRILVESGRRVVASCSFDIGEALGVNTPEQLAEVEARLSGA